jgi:lycopene cyclase domain-containing protein
MALTYLEFHAVFVVPPLVGLGIVLGGRTRRSEVRPLAVALILGLALAYTIPWDNYLVGRGVWEYGADRVLATLWLAPVEEYAFIVLQSVVAALWLSLVARERAVSVVVGHRHRLVGLGAGLAIAVAGLLATTRPAGFYLGAILAWAGPVLGLQWAVGWPYLLARWRTVLVGILPPTAYLCVVDAVAIDLGIWRFSAELTTGLTLLGLPIEEATFFLVTNALVVQGLLLYPWVIERWR